MTRLWWVRHGPTHAKEMIGWTDRPADLSDSAALERLRAHLPQGAPAISSDLIRARATAEALAPGRCLPPRQDLREIHFGDWEGLRFAEAEARDSALIREFWERPGPVAAPGGESWTALQVRVNAAVDAILAERWEDVIVVAHFGTILTQVERALGIPTVEAFAQKIEPLSVTRIDRAGKDWILQSVNHLP
jgi:broad specificity phosphatase PhoE